MYRQRNAHESLFHFSAPGAESCTVTANPQYGQGKVSFCTLPFKSDTSDEVLNLSVTSKKVHITIFFFLTA